MLREMGGFVTRYFDTPIPHMTPKAIRDAANTPWECKHWHGRLTIPVDANFRQVAQSVFECPDCGAVRLGDPIDFDRKQTNISLVDLIAVSVEI